MKVAVIGANGFVGSRVVELFTLTGAHAVVPVVRRPSALALPARFDLPWAIGNALDVESLTRAIAGCEAVVHCAIGDARQIRRMPQVLCEAAAAAGVRRIVYLSSASVHGQDFPPGSSEESPLHTRHLIEYNNAKVDAERQLFSASRRLQCETFALRPSVVFGPRSTWIADAVRDLRAGRAWLYRDGDGICNTIYVDNLVHAIDCALQAPASAAGVYLVGDAQTITWKQFYGGIATHLGLEHHHLHRIDQLPVFRRSLRDRFSSLLAQPWMMKLMPAFPATLKRMVKGAIQNASPPAAIDHWKLPDTPAPSIDHAMALLQQCRQPLQSGKAAAALGYSPAVTVDEGLRRSVLWARYVLDLA